MIFFMPARKLGFSLQRMEEQPGICRKMARLMSRSMNCSGSTETWLPLRMDAASTRRACQFYNSTGLVSVGSLSALGDVTNGGIIALSSFFSANSLSMTRPDSTLTATRADLGGDLSNSGSIVITGYGGMTVHGDASNLGSISLLNTYDFGAKSLSMGAGSTLLARNVGIGGNVTNSGTMEGQVLHGGGTGPTVYYS